MCRALGTSLWKIVDSAKKVIIAKVLFSSPGTSTLIKMKACHGMAKPKFWWLTLSLTLNLYHHHQGPITHPMTFLVQHQQTRNERDTNTSATTWLFNVGALLTQRLLDTSRPSCSSELRRPSSQASGKLRRIDAFPVKPGQVLESPSRMVLLGIALSISPVSTPKIQVKKMGPASNC